MPRKDNGTGKDTGTEEPRVKHACKNQEVNIEQTEIRPKENKKEE